jgi:hypothetical protein
VEALIYFIVCLVGNGLLPLWLPWWIIVPINFFFVFPFRFGKGIAFWLGGFASGTAWLAYSLWLSNENQHILAPRLTKLLTLPHPILLFTLIFLLPFVLGGVSSMTGIMFKNFFKTNAY